MQEEIMQEVIKTVHCDEISELFKRLGIYSEINNNKIKCKICGKIITEKNFKVITKKNGQYIFCCNNDDCYGKFI